MINRYQFMDIENVQYWPITDILCKHKSICAGNQIMALTLKEKRKQYISQPATSYSITTINKNQVKMNQKVHRHPDHSHEVQMQTH